jgi:endonuclease/exonuclease/phosphatase (EEP) superfamily protein YafD
MSTFKVLQFNMQFGQTWDDAYPDHAPHDLDLTVSEIRRQNADVVLLQEVEQGWPGGAQIEPPPNYTYLRKVLGQRYDGFFSYPKADRRELPFGIGLAIFSKSKLIDRLRLNVPSPPVEFEFRGEMRTPTDRLLIAATTRIAGRKLRVFNTHLLAFFMLRADRKEHPGQRELVLEQLRASNGPRLLGGDFNVSRHESLVRQFKRAGYSTVQTKKVTWRRRPYVLDHIFYNKDLRLMRQAVKPTLASDHHMLVAEFEFNK